MTENNSFDEVEMLCAEEIEFKKEEMIFTASVQMMAKDSSKAHAG